LALLALVGVVVAIVIALAANSTHRGTGPPPSNLSAPHLAPVSLGQTSAHDYNPFGDVPEHPDEVSNAVDGDPNTAWSTEHYKDGNLGKPGVGIYVDAQPGLAARALSIQTPTPGFFAAIYASSSFEKGLPLGDHESLTERGWKQLSRPQRIGAQTTIHLGTAGKRYRYYLVWITKLQPAGGEPAVSAQISEVALFG
jgi:hypothetical protein